MPSSREAKARKCAESHCAAFPKIAAVTAQEFMELRGPNCVVVDVRTREERRVARIPGSISRRAFETSLEEDDYRERDVVVYCTVGRRSGAYATALEKRHLCRSVRNSHGIVAYSHHDDAYGEGPHALVDDDDRPAERIHVYARPWNFANERFAAVEFGFFGAIAATWRD